MKIRRLADAAIVAAMLMTSIPNLNVSMTPEDLLAHAAVSAAVPIADHCTPDESSDNSASRKLC